MKLRLKVSHIVLGTALAAPLSLCRGDALSDAQAAYVAQGFGMFVHFSMPTAAQYYFTPNQPNSNIFNPYLLDTDQWAATAKSAGMKYIVLTAKHVDGFALWNTAKSTYNASNTTWAAQQAPGQTDIVARFQASCNKYGLGMGLYFNMADFSNGIFDGDNPYLTADVANRPPSYYAAPHDNAYNAAYDVAQIRELVQRYPGVKAIWADTYGWGIPRYKGDDHSIEVNAAVKSVSPSTLMIVNGSPDISDIVTYERTTPGVNNTIPAEVCDYLADNWFYEPFKSSMQPRLTPAQIASTVNTFKQRAASYLLDVTVDRSGLIPQSQVDALVQTGTLLGVTGAPTINARPVRPVTQTLVANPSFEGNAVGSVPSGGWSAAGNVHVVDASTWAAAPGDGNRYALFTPDATRHASGTLSQTIQTIAGQEYMVWFKMGVQGTDTGNVGVRIDASGTPSNEFWVQSDYFKLYPGAIAVPLTDFELLDQVYKFTATSSLTTLSFQDITDYEPPPSGALLDYTSGVNGLALDGISVGQVPEPSTASVAFAATLAFLGRRRRNGKRDIH